MNEILANTFKLVAYVWDYPHRKVGDVAETIPGGRLVRSALGEGGTIPVYGGSLKPLGYHTEANRPGDTTFVVVKGNAGDVGYSAEPFYAADGCLCLKPIEGVLSKFLFYAIEARRPALLPHVRTWGVAGLSRTDVENLEICVPCLDEQLRITEFLDQYNSVCLPDLKREAELRKQQGEYYHNKLLKMLEPCR